MKFLTGGIVHEREQNGCDSRTDGKVRMKEVETDFVMPRKGRF